MKSELIDQLDEKGNLIGTIDKAVAHKEGLWHRSVHVWIINDNHQILLQKRAADKDFYPNVWDVSFAGHVGAGEESIITAVREGGEELGLKVDSDKLEYLFTNKEVLVYSEVKSNEFVDIYLLRQNIDIEDIVLQTEEVGEVKYVDMAEFLHMIDSKDKDLFPHINEYEQLRELLL